MLLSVIIPNWNNKELLRACLKSLSKQESRDFEVVVVDNGSSDGSADMVEKDFPEVRIARLPENKGFSAAVNLGIKNSKGELVALINNDAEAHPSWLKELYQSACRHPEAGSFASKILFHSDRKTIDTFGDGFSRCGYGFKIGWGERDEGQFDRESYVLGACGGAALYRRSMLEAVKVEGEYFDEDFFAFGEDLDLALRAQLSGHKCIAVPGAIVYHRVRATAGRNSELPVFLGHRNFLFCVMKNFPRKTIIKNLASIILYPVMASLWDMFKKRRLVFIKCYINAFRKRKIMMQKRALVQTGKKIPNKEFERLLAGQWIINWFRIGLRTRAVRKNSL